MTIEINLLNIFCEVITSLKIDHYECNSMHTHVQNEKCESDKLSASKMQSVLHKHCSNNVTYLHIER